MSITRGQFLKSLGASAGNAAMSTGLAVAAKLIGATIATKLDGGAMAAGSRAKMPEAVEPPFLTNGPAEGNLVALTFDDGPTPGITEPILDLLKARGLVASFFMIGQRAEAEPDLAKRVAEEGHAICNHSYTHPKLGEMADAQVEEELTRTQETLATITGHRPTIFRPPYGSFRQNQGKLAHKLGLRVVMWSVDTRDWSQPGEDQIAEAILSGTKSGSIILCHELHRQTVDCLGRVLDQLLGRDFKFVPVTAFATSAT